jgi:hypothetical protein
MAKNGKYEFRTKQTVYAVEALPGVPRGTKGFVILPGGISWHRYRVRFDNGVEMGLIDEGKLTAKPVN